MRPRAWSGERSDRARVGPVKVGDEVRRRLHSLIRLLAEANRAGQVAAVGGDPAEPIKGEHLHGGVANLSSALEELPQAGLGGCDILADVEGGQQALA